VYLDWNTNSKNKTTKHKTKLIFAVRAAKTKLKFQENVKFIKCEIHRDLTLVLCTFNLQLPEMCSHVKCEKQEQVLGVSP
jgi:hypothetical protein